jgi:hypothetical protein
MLQPPQGDGTRIGLFREASLPAPNGSPAGTAGVFTTLTATRLAEATERAPRRNAETTCAPPATRPGTEPDIPSTGSGKPV